MPTLKVARRQANASVSKADFESVWAVVDPKNISYEGQGVFSYTGAGGTSQDDIGLIKTKFPLDPNGMGGISSFEMTLTETG